MDIFELFGEYSYFGIFLVLIGVNASPILMPPSWIVLTSFYLLDPTLNIVILAAVGATGATIGRFFLKRISGLFRKFVGKEQKSNLDIIGDYLTEINVTSPTCFKEYKELCDIDVAEIFIEAVEEFS